MLKRFAARILPHIFQHVPRDKKWLYPFFLAGNWQLIQEEIRIDSLPSSLEGYQIAYASDIHFGPYLDEAKAFELYRQIVGLKPDLIILGGDYGNLQANGIAFFHLLPPFPKEIPVIASIGNHDYGAKGSNIEPLLSIMMEKNVTPLINQTRIFNVHQHSIAICAPDDVLCGQPDYEALQLQTSRADFVLFAPHSPDAVPDAINSGLHFDLALCGHTHGGQIAFAGRSLHSSSRYGDRYRLGWYHENGKLLHVSSGIGTSLLPMRIGTRASLHLFVLQGKG